MLTKFKKICTISLAIVLISGCSTVSGNTNNDSSNIEKVSSNEPNYKEAINIYSRLVIIYSQEGYLDLAKERLLYVNKLVKEHGFYMPIVSYASGYYYQTIGADSVAETKYKKALNEDDSDFQAMNFYAQFLCQVKGHYSQAEDYFNKSMTLSTNNDMAQTLFIFSECEYKKGDTNKAIKLMARAEKFRTDYSAAKLRLSEMYFEQKNYKECYKVLYSMQKDKKFFNNRRVLELRLKLAEYANNNNEAAKVRLILSSNKYNDDNINDFFSASDDGDK